MRKIQDLPQHEQAPFRRFLADRLAQQPKPGWFYESDYQYFVRRQQ